MPEPTFSVVTISFNQSDYLRRAMESVLSQEGVGVEYIVCDPGSTDGSRTIIDSYGDRIAHRVYEKDKGPADGLNKGFARATGEIFAYLNSDDVLLPGALRRVADWFGEHPDVDVVSGHALVTDGDDRVLRRTWSEPFSRRMVAYGASVQIQPSTFIRAAAFRCTSGFNVENRSIWDGELMTDLFLSGAKMAIMNDTLSCYRLHETSITNTGSQEEGRRRAVARRFRKLMGRDPRWIDGKLRQALVLWKHLRQPRMTMERLVRGPIYRRSAR